LWQLDDRVARLQLPRCGAALDVARPREGLRDVYLDARRWGGTRLLAVAAAAAMAGDAGAPIECYARGPDLVTAYEGSQDRPLRVDAVWRGVVPTTDQPLVAGVELIVSVRTELLDGCPELTVRSVLCAAEAWRLVHAGSSRYDAIAALPIDVRPADGPGCILVRPQEAAWTYAEMVHPVDFYHDVLCQGPDAEQSLALEHHLFPVRLEKGVILRARVRGVFVPREDDRQTVAACYQAFAAAEPPLST
jgi:hypothetical protein